MNPNNEPEKDFDALRLMRNMRDKMSQEIAGMSFTQLQAYFNRRRQAYLKQVGKTSHKISGRDHANIDPDHTDLD